MVSEFSTLRNRRRARACHAIIPSGPPVGPVLGAAARTARVRPSHPLGCHKRRIPDETVFRLVVEALVHGSGYERIAIGGCSDWTIRVRVKTWSALGLAHELHCLALAAYDRMIGLELDDLSADGCHTKAPIKGDKAGRSPVDRGKQGLKRSTLVEARGVPLGIASAGANRHDSKLLEPTITAARGNSGHCRARPGSTWTPPTTASRAGRYWTITPSSARSPPRACQPRSRSASGGLSNDPSRG